MIQTKYTSKEVLEAILQAEREPALKETGITVGRVKKQREVFRGIFHLTAGSSTA